MSCPTVRRVKAWRVAAALIGAGLISLSSAAAEDVPARALPLRLIVVSTQDDAQRIHDQLKSGADFAVLARLKSVDETSADGGLLGDVDPATLREELKSALQGLEPGQISRWSKCRMASPF